MAYSHGGVQRTWKEKAIPDAQKFSNCCLCHFCFYSIGKNKSCDQVQSPHEKGLPKCVVMGTCDKLSNVFEAIYHIWFLQRFSPLWSVIFFPLDTDLAFSSILLLTYLAAPKNLLITMTSICWGFRPMGSPLGHGPRKPKAICLTQWPIPHLWEIYLLSKLGNISWAQFIYPFFAHILKG